MQYEEWTNYDKQLVGYIKTRAKPAIFYKPAELTPRTEKKLSETTAVIEGSVIANFEALMINFLGYSRENQEATGGG